MVNSVSKIRIHGIYCYKYHIACVTFYHTTHTHLLPSVWPWNCHYLFLRPSFLRPRIEPRSPAHEENARHLRHHGGLFWFDIASENPPPHKKPKTKTNLYVQHTLCFLTIRIKMCKLCLNPNILNIVSYSKEYKELYNYKN